MDPENEVARVQHKSGASRERAISKGKQKPGNPREAPELPTSENGMTFYK